MYWREKHIGPHEPVSLRDQKRWEEDTHLIAGQRLVVSPTLVDHPPNFVDFATLLDDPCDVVEQTLRLVVDLGWYCLWLRGGWLNGPRERIAVDVEFSDVTRRKTLATEGTFVLHQVVKTSGGEGGKTLFA